MKINVEIDISPEELRRFFGLPDVQGFQQEMIDRFASGFQTSQEQRDEFMRTLFTGAMAPWQNFFTLLAQGQSDQSK